MGVDRHSSDAEDTAQSRMMDAAGEWHDDPLIMDERYVAVNVKGRGPVVLSACSHSGIVNVLHDAAAVADSQRCCCQHSWFALPTAWPGLAREAVQPLSLP